MKIYTIGYGGRKIEEFVEVLRKHGITMVIDVRRFPKSKDPLFSKESLEIFLGENGIKYVFFGENLGGFVKGGYEKYMETQSFKEGIKILLSVVKGEVAVLMCREKNVKYCHRRFISKYLKNLGVEVIHI